jgi:RNA polymerase sigma-70 factor (ECF subfamily)
MTDEPTHAADAALVKAAREGDPAAVQAFNTRMRCVAAMLGALNRRFGKAVPEADLADVVQETLLKVWKKLGSFAGGARLETWVFQFCFLELKNAMRRQRRREGREASLDDVAPPAMPVAAGGGPAFDVERVLLLLERLDPDDAAVIRMRHFEGLEFDAIGARCGRPGNTVKTRYHRALMKLRRWLGASPPTEAERAREEGAT